MPPVSISQSCMDFAFPSAFEANNVNSSKSSSVTHCKNCEVTPSRTHGHGVVSLSSDAVADRRALPHQPRLLAIETAPSDHASRTSMAIPLTKDDQRDVPRHAVHVSSIQGRSRLHMHRGRGPETVFNDPVLSDRTLRAFLQLRLRVDAPPNQTCVEQTRHDRTTSPPVNL